MSSFPIPPIEFRRLVGRTDEKFYDGSIERTPFDHLPGHCFASVLDFGGDAGRLAGSLMLMINPLDLTNAVIFDRNWIARPPLS